MQIEELKEINKMLSEENKWLKAENKALNIAIKNLSKANDNLDDNLTQMHQLLDSIQENIIKWRRS